MYAIRSYYEPISGTAYETVVTALRSALSRMSAARITSYNVCYTKLLRIAKQVEVIASMSEENTAAMNEAREASEEMKSLSTEMP